MFRIVIYLVIVCVFALNVRIIESSCIGDGPPPQYEFFATSTCKKRRSDSIALVPNEDIAIGSLFRQCISLRHIANKVNYTFPRSANVWTRWHCPVNRCGSEYRFGVISVYHHRKCTGHGNVLRFKPLRHLCIDRPGGGYVILRCSW